MSKRKPVMIMIVLIMLVALGGCAPSIKTSVDFTKSDYTDKVDVEADDSAMPSGSAAGTSYVEPADYVWAHEHGLVVRRGRVFTKDAYKGDFKAELVVDIQYAPPAAEGFVLGIGFKELPITDPWPNLFKAVQFYGNHTGLPEAIAAYTVLPHMLYTSLVSLEDGEMPDVLPFVDELLPGLVIGDGVVSGTNTIVLERKGGTISISVNATLVGTYESEYLLGGYLTDRAFHDLNVERPIRIGVFSACVHAEGDYDEGVFLRSLKVYADELIQP